jgi:hypothetical protein
MSFDTAATISGVSPAVTRISGGISRVRQQPVAEITHGEMRNLGERLARMIIDDETRDLVHLVWDHGFVEESAQRHLRQRHFRRHAFFFRVGGHACQLVA